jgi:tRNA dimethylallyltransferase
MLGNATMAAQLLWCKVYRSLISCFYEVNSWPMDRVVVCIMGPTAVGKTDVALALAANADVDLISVDSAMVYRGLDIGTAKPDKETRERFPHALIDILDPIETFSAAAFLKAADQAVTSALSCGRLPVLVGGTMLYFRAFRDGLSPLPSADTDVRELIEVRAKKSGWPAMHAELLRVDPTAAEGIHPNNPQRIQRALEVFYVTGIPISDWWKNCKGETVAQRLDCDLVQVGLELEREALTLNIEARFDDMLLHGLIDEVERLREIADLCIDHPSMRAVGYRQVWQHLEGQFDVDTMRDKALVATRQLAKRQVTWLRSWPELQRIHALDDAAGPETILKLLN